MDVQRNKLTDITFSLIVDSAPNAILVVNEQGRIAYVNRRGEELFGYSSAALIGQPVETLIPERFHANHVGYRSDFIKAPALRSMGVGRELSARRQDGSEFPIEIGLNPLVLVDGTWVLATVIDITERKQAEERFRSVVQSAPNAMILVDQRGVIHLANQQATVLPASVLRASHLC
jgi:PAS domain S-box-containing protein